MANDKLKAISFLVFYSVMFQGMAWETRRVELPGGDHDVHLGDNVTLDCAWRVAYNECRWEKDGVEIPLKNTSRYQVHSNDSGNCSLTILHFRPSDEGIWECYEGTNSSLLRNPAPTQQASLSLTKPDNGTEEFQNYTWGAEKLHVQIRTVELLGNHEVHFGDNITLNCAWRVPYNECHWEKDGIDVALKNTSRYHLLSDNSGNCSLTILSFRSTDEGAWQCYEGNSSLLSDPAPTQQAFLSLIKSAGHSGPREFVYRPYNQTVPIGYNVILKCTFNTLSPSCYWIKDGDVIRIEGRYRFTGNKHSGDCSIKIANVGLFDDGIWQCGYPRTDSEKALKSNSANLSVAIAPSEPVIVVNGLAMKNGQKLYVSSLRQQQLQLSCWSENGNPAAKLEWSVGKGKSHQRLSHRDTERVFPSTLHPALKISVLSFSISFDGEWQQQDLMCRASHPAYGKHDQTTSIQLILAYAPPVRHQYRHSYPVFSGFPG